MSDSFDKDRDLLARLNALKKSSVDFDTKASRFDTYGPAKTGQNLDPAPARALHVDLLSRFKSLTGEDNNYSLDKCNHANEKSDLLADEDGKTVEELLAELGPEESWSLPKDEESQIDELLKSAHQTLGSSKVSDTQQGNETEHRSNTVHEFYSEDISSSLQQDEESEEERLMPKKSGKEIEAEITHEADDYIAKMLDEIKNDPKPDFISEQPDDTVEDTRGNIETPFQLPSAPSKELENTPDEKPSANYDELASRFANLGLPSVPTTFATKKFETNPSIQTKPKHAYTDEEIDSWCIICNEDATLRCIGCDGDLYCTNCWLEGHRGEDAGYEERKHRAIQYNKGGGMKKQPARRVMMGS